MREDDQPALAPLAVYRDAALYADRLETPDGTYPLDGLVCGVYQKVLRWETERRTATRIVAGAMIAGPAGGAVGGMVKKREQHAKAQGKATFQIRNADGETIYAAKPHGDFGRRLRAFTRALAQAQA
jgi:hypothetical protein